MQQQAIEEPASSEELDAVDFMDGEDIAAKVPGPSAPSENNLNGSLKLKCQV